MKIVMLVACHKPCRVPADPMYYPIQVGSAGKQKIEQFHQDDTGINISSENDRYCELTGLYWAWKNMDCDYLGLVQYRRYFSEGKTDRKDPLESVLTQKQTEQILKDHRIIIPRKRRYYIETIYSHYSHTFSQKQLDEARKVIESSAPDYLCDFDSYMHQTWGYMFNMFLMPKKLCDQYCEWLFPLLEQLDARIDTSEMTAFEKRFLGRVSERLFDVWLFHQIRNDEIRKEEIYECRYIYTAKVNKLRKVTGFIEAKLFHKKYTESF